MLKIAAVCETELGNSQKVSPDEEHSVGKVSLCDFRLSIFRMMLVHNSLHAVLQHLMLLYFEAGDGKR